MDYPELDEFWQRKLDEVLEMLKNRKPIPEPVEVLPPLPRIRPKTDRVLTFRIEERESRRADPGWSRWVIYKDHHIWGYADTEEEAHRMIPEGSLVY